MNCSCSNYIHNCVWFLVRITVMGWKNKEAIMAFYCDRKILLDSLIMPMGFMQGPTHQKWWFYDFLLYMTFVTCINVWHNCFLTPSREARSLYQALEFSALFNALIWIIFSFCQSIFLGQILSTLALRVMSVWFIHLHSNKETLLTWFSSTES